MLFFCFHFHFQMNEELCFAFIGFYLILIFIHTGHDLIFKNVPFCISLALSSHYFMCRFHDFKFIVGFGHIIVCCFLQEIIWCGMWGLTTYKINWFFFFTCMAYFEKIYDFCNIREVLIVVAWLIIYLYWLLWPFLGIVVQLVTTMLLQGRSCGFERRQFQLIQWFESFPLLKIYLVFTYTLSQLILSYIYSIHSYLGRAMCFC